MGGFGVIIGAIAVGGSVLLFLNVPSLIIVIGGTIAATLMQFPLGHFFGAFKVALKAFISKVEEPAKLIEEAMTLSQVARKSGLLALEGQEISRGAMESDTQ